MNAKQTNFDISIFPTTSQAAQSNEQQIYLNKKHKYARVTLKVWEVKKWNKQTTQNRD